MKLLFVASGNYSRGISPIISNQAETIINNGIEVDIFLIRGRGLYGYFKSIWEIRRKIRSNHYDLVHAHFFYSAIVATLSGIRPIVVSLMGSDVYGGVVNRILIKLFRKLFWSIVIVKSNKMKDMLSMKNVIVLPNGVDFTKYYPMNRNDVRKHLNLDVEKKYILFASDPQREEKNYTLAKRAVEIINKDEIELLVVYDKPNSIIPYYINASNVVVLTSKWEGSPNIIKEAMACNIPIVSTNVGDVSERIKGVSGCFICNDSPNDIANKIKYALNIDRAVSREKIKDLDSKEVANKILKIYNNVVNK